MTKRVYSDRELLELFRMLLRAQIREERINSFSELEALLSHVEEALAAPDSADGEFWKADALRQTLKLGDARRALGEANAFILAPAEDLKEGVLSRIRDALAKAEGR